MAEHAPTDRSLDERFPNWSNPEGKLQEYVTKRYCSPVPRHPIHPPIDVSLLIVQLRGAVDTLAPAWLSARIMKDAAYALEGFVNHCYQCDANLFDEHAPCDDGSTPRDEAERAADKCPKYAERCKNGMPKV